MSPVVGADPHFPPSAGVAYVKFVGVWHMPEQYDDEEETYDSDSSDGDSLLRDLRRQLKVMSRENKDLKTVNAGFQQKVRQDSLAATLQTKGLNPKIAKLVPVELVDDDEALDEWLNDYSDLFGGSRPETEADTEVEVQGVQDSSAQNKANQLFERGTTPAGGFGDFTARMAKAASADEIAEILAEAKHFSAN